MPVMETNRTEFNMFTPAGNRAARQIVNAALKLPMGTSNDDLYAFLTLAMNKVANQHGEIWDTDVREAMIGAIEKATGRDELSIYF